MKDFEIKIKGKTLPCRITLRAMLKFKQVTGRDWGALEGNGITDFIIFLWCCVWATCATEGVEFNDDLDEFSGHLDASVFSRWMTYISENSKHSEDSEHSDGGLKKKA